ISCFPCAKISASMTTYLNASWGTISNSAYSWNYLYQDGRLDPTSGTFSFRGRDLSPSLGRWLQVDPISLQAGDANLYRGEADTPINLLDPSGRSYLKQGWTPSAKSINAFERQHIADVTAHAAAASSGDSTWVPPDDDIIDQIDQFFAGWAHFWTESTAIR